MRMSWSLRILDFVHDMAGISSLYPPMIHAMNLMSAQRNMSAKEAFMNIRMPVQPVLPILDHRVLVVNMKLNVVRFVA